MEHSVYLPISLRHFYRPPTATLLKCYGLPVLELQAMVKCASEIIVKIDACQKLVAYFLRTMGRYLYGNYFANSTSHCLTLHVNLYKLSFQSLTQSKKIAANQYFNCFQF